MYILYLNIVVDRIKLPLNFLINDASNIQKFHNLYFFEYVQQFSSIWNKLFISETCYKYKRFRNLTFKESNILPAMGQILAPAFCYVLSFGGCGSFP